MDFPSRLALMRNFRRVPLCLLDFIREAKISFQTHETGSLFSNFKIYHAPGYRFFGIFTMTGIDSQRAAVGGQLFNIEESQPMRSETLFQPW